LERWVHITKATPQGSISGTSPIDYGTTGDVEGTETNTGDGDVDYKLFRDNTEVSNPDTTTLGAGTYEYVYNVTGGTNYTDNSSIGTFSLTVNQIASSVFLYVNGSRADTKVENGTQLWINSTREAGEYNVSLYVDSSLINSSSTGAKYYYNFTGGGLINVTAIYYETQNYTFSSETWFVNVTQPSADTTPPIFNNLRNFTHTVNTSFSQSITATDDTAIDTYKLNQTDTFNINSTSGLITNITQLSEITIYYLNISVNDTSGNMASGIFWINVTEQVVDWINPNPIYGTQSCFAYNYLNPPSWSNCTR